MTLILGEDLTYMHSATILGRSINTEFIDEGTLFYGKTNWRKHQADYDGLIGPDHQILSPYQILMDHKLWCSYDPFTVQSFSDPGI